MDDKEFVAVQANADVSTKSVHASYRDFSTAIQATMDMNRAGIHGANVFRTDITGDQIVEAYLSGFPESVRQYNNCSICLRTLRTLGNLVIIDAEGKATSLLFSGAEVDGYYRPSVDAMHKLFEKAKVVQVYHNKHVIFGEETAGGFDHLHLTIDMRAMHPMLSDNVVGKATIKDFELLQSKIFTYDVSTFDLMLKYFAADADLRNYPEQRHTLGKMRELVEKVKNADSSVRNNLLWNVVANKSMDLVHFHNTVMGEFYDNINPNDPARAVKDKAIADGIKKMSGNDAPIDFWNIAKRKYIAMVDPKYFRRPQAAPSEGNVAMGEKIFETMGLKPSAVRRFADLADVQEFKWQPKPEPEEAEAGIFDHLKTKKPKKVPLSLDGTIIEGGKIAWDRFVEKHLPTADYIDVVFADNMKFNFGGLATAVHPESPPILRWDSVEKRNQVNAFVIYQGAAARAVNLEPHVPHRVTGIFDVPENWGKEKKELTNTYLLSIEDAKVGAVSGLMLFPDNCIPELRAVRSTIEAYSNAGSLQSPERDTAFLGIGGEGQAVMVDFIVSCGGVKTRFMVDRSS